jgi:hypothetical protein
MSDQLEDLFAVAREEAMRQIQPPGTGRARTIVRLRRRRRRVMLAAACAVLVATLGAATLWRGSGTSTATSDRLGEQGTTLFRYAGSTDLAYRKSLPVFLGNLTMEVACAGDGRLTLLIEGVPGAETGETTPVEQARTTAQCSGQPMAASSSFAVSSSIGGLTARIVVTGGVSDFAYRLASDTGRPLTADDPDADPVAALGTVDGTVYDEPRVEPGAARSLGGTDPGRLTFACAGNGTAELELRTLDGTKTTARHELGCGWPAPTDTWTVGGGTLWITFRPAGGGTAPARVAWAWEPRS